MSAHYTDEGDTVRRILNQATGCSLHNGETNEKRRVLTVSAVDVVLLRWPADQARRDELHQVGCPRLLLIEEGPPPLPVDDLEDWIRVPAGDTDLRARVDGLRQRAADRTRPRPELDDDGVLRLDGRWVSLPPVEARLTVALIGRFGAVVPRDSLARAGWPAGAPGRNALDVHMLRLRRRLSAVGLAIRTVRSRGYLLERAEPNPLGPRTEH